MASASGLEAQIKALIVEALALEDVQPEEIETEAPLFVEGLGLDSIDALELVLGLEQEFKIKVEDEEVGVKAFASVNAPPGWSCLGTVTCTASSLAASATATFTVNVTVNPATQGGATTRSSHCARRRARSTAR